MTTMRRDPLVDDYLRRLRTAAGGLPRERRAELVEEIEQHIAEALAEESDVRGVLERLGTPEEIAAAAGPPARGRRERAALIVLTVSFVLPVIGYLIGARLVLSSSAWDGRDKLRALVVPPLLLFGGALVVLLAATGVARGGTSDSGLGPVEIAVLVAYALSGPAAALYLSSRPRL